MLRGLCGSWSALWIGLLYLPKICECLGMIEVSVMCGGMEWLLFTCGSIQSRSGDWIGLGLVELVGIWGRVSCDEHLDALPQIKNPLYPRQSGLLCSQTQIYQRPSRLPLYAKQNLCIEKVVRSLQTCVHDPVFIYVGCPGLQKLGWVRHLTKTQTDNRMKILHHPNKSHDTCRYAQLLFW